MIKIFEIFKRKKEEIAEIKAWVLLNRGNKKIRFLIVNDGSTFKNLQIVLKDELAIKSSLITMGSSLIVEGEINLTPNKDQELELIATKISFKKADEDFPLQKKNMSLKYLREVPHLRVRTQVFRAIMRIRSTLFQEIHFFFNKKNFLNVSTPIITGNDGEGAGETFCVTTGDKENFFGNEAKLGVTGQLHAEAFANGFGNVYTFGPTFRAEKSHTQKHASEFWMLEPEMAFWNKEETIDFVDLMLKEIIKKTILKNSEEIKFLTEKIDTNLSRKLDLFLKNPIKKIRYEKVIEKLKENKSNFDDQDIFFGLDLKTEHERFLSEKIFGGPVAVVDFPQKIKAFYMKLNNDKKTVGAFDVLVPGIGELVGGSERETDYKQLLKSTEERKMDLEDIKWYLNLRRFGQFQSTGFGLGFERLVMFVTGVDNIRDVIPFPRTPKNMKM